MFYSGIRILLFRENVRNFKNSFARKLRQTAEMGTIISRKAHITTRYHAQKIVEFREGLHS
jgi:hypothetical protein